MLNIEKYKDDILDTETGSITCSVNVDILHLPCSSNCIECKKNAMEWLLSEYKEPILDDVEKKYLSAVIKPYKNYVTGIIKIKGDYDKDRQYIRIIVNKYTQEHINLPWFEENTMYKGMKGNKKYTLEDLGL